MSQTPLDSTGRSAIIFGVLSIAILWGLADSVLEVSRADRAETWPSADGVVVESSSGQICGRKGNGYRTVVRYRYQVGGVAYEGSRIIFGAASCDARETAKAMTDQFPFAAVVKVRYDPQAPSSAVLIPGQVDQSTRFAIAFLSLFLFITAAATGMLVIVARSNRALPHLPDPADPADKMSRPLCKRRD